jgi:hypothetical protein
MARNKQLDMVELDLGKSDDEKTGLDNQIQEKQKITD